MIETENNSTKRIYRDSLFRDYFRDPKNFVALCNAVTGLNLTAEDITENTVDDVLFSNPRNDVSFSVGNCCFIFFEHQSTRNFNMPLRMLYYLAALYRSTVPDDLIYKTKMIPLPSPKFFVFYNGIEPCPEESLLKLSDAFCMAADIEITVHVYNVNYDEKFKLLGKCQPIHDYSYFINEIDKNKSSGMNLDRAVIAAMQTCIDRDIMRDYLKLRKLEVFEMINLVWNEEAAKKSYIAQGREIGLEEGRAEGRSESKLEMVKNLLKEKMSFDFIAKITGLSKYEILKISDELKG